MVSPLARILPNLARRLELAPLGEFPTPVERLESLERALGGTAPLYVKRDDLSSPTYGGNKVRTLEVLFGLARARGARQVFASGAYGSNHAVATVLHAARAGLEPGAILFPQPRSLAALENLRVTAARAQVLRWVPHWSLLPFALFAARGPGRSVMVPGGATAEGALGYVSAGVELALQMQRGELLQPERIFVGIGSTCTTAGLLVGLELARHAGIVRGVPTIVAVRVTPWPVTSRTRILALAERTARKLAELTGDERLAFSRSVLAPRLTVDNRELGPGYGWPSRSGLAALGLFLELGLFPLDTTYSSKACAAFLRAARAAPAGPLLFWSTKSSAPLPVIAAEDLRAAPPAVQRWMARAEREASLPGR